MIMAIMGLSLLSVPYPSVLSPEVRPQDLSDHRLLRKPILAISRPGDWSSGLLLLWVDGINLDVCLEQDKICLLVIVPVRHRVPTGWPRRSRTPEAPSFLRCVPTARLVSSDG